MEFGHNKPVKRKALMNDDNAGEDAKPWKLFRISPVTVTTQRQTHSSTPYELISMICNAGFTESTTKRFQEQFDTLEDLDKINRALIVTGIRMWKQVKCGQLRVMEAGKLMNGMFELPIPFATYYNRLDTPMKRLIELMNDHLDEKQFNEVMIRCIKKDLKSNDKNDLGTTSDLSEPRYSALKREDNYKETIKYYKFPPVEIPCSSCKIYINDYEEKFLFVNCHDIMDKFSKNQATYE